MSSLRSRFRTIDVVAAPDLWTEVTRLAEMPGVSGLDRVRARPRGRQAAPDGLAGRRGFSTGWAMGLVALLLVAVTGSFLLGGAVDPSASPTIAPTTSPAAVHTSSPRETPSPTETRPTVAPVSTPVPVTVTVVDGTAESALGQVSWSRTWGDANVLPGERIFETPDGFAAFESDRYGPARMWASADGVDWTLGPAPVPASGRMQHAFTAGEHWIWSTDGFQLWQSPDFVTWTEVDLADYVPPPLAGFDWYPVFSGLATANGTTLLQLRPVAVIDFAELFALPPQSFQNFKIGVEGADLAIGDVIDIFLRGGRAEPVGAIRIDYEGSIVTVTDASRGVVVSEINAASLGVDAPELAEHLAAGGDIHLPGRAVVISDGVARPAAYLQDALLVALDGRFIGLPRDLDEGSESHSVWVSADGQRWDSLGAPVWLGASADVSIDWLLADPASEAIDGLTIAAMVDGPGIPQHTELWSSDDALTWTRVGMLPGANLNTVPHRVAGGYVALGDDHRIYVSSSGTEWNAIEGPDPGQLGDRSSGSSTASSTGSLSTTRDDLFITETFGRNRVLWKVSFAAR